MIDGIEPFYERIGNALVGALPEIWHHAWMDAIFYSEHTSFHGSYQGIENGEWHSFGTPLDAQDAMREMRELFNISGKRLWCRVRFGLYSSGKFAIRFSYDNCDENGFARFDEDALNLWRKQYAAGKPVPLFGAE